jgi:hypothetical protein
MPNVDKDLLKDLNPSQRRLYNVVNTQLAARKVMVWDLSYFSVAKFIDQWYEGAEEGYEFFDSPGPQGYSLKFKFDEDSFQGNKYYTNPRVDPVQRVVKYKKSIESEIVNLDAALIVRSYDDIFKLFNEGVASDAPQDDDDYAASASASVPADVPKGSVRGTKKAPPIDEDEGGEDYDDVPVTKPAAKAKAPAPPEEDDGDVSPPAPAKAKKPQSPPPVDEDDDDDDIPVVPPKAVTKPTKPAKPTKPPVDEDDEDADPVTKPAAKPTKPAKAPPVDDDDDDEAWPTR